MSTYIAAALEAKHSTQEVADAFREQALKLRAELAAAEADDPRTAEADGLAKRYREALAQWRKAKTDAEAARLRHARMRSRPGSAGWWPV